MNDPRTSAPFGRPQRELAALVRRHADEVIRVWAPAARAAVAGARHAPPLVLADMLRESLDDLAAALERAHDGAGPPPPVVAHAVAYAAVHGAERAAVPHYDVAQVVREYRLLRHALMQVLAREIRFGPADVDALSDCIDQFIEAAVDAFTESLRETQSNQIRGLVHDLLNPLSIIRMNAQAIERAADQPDQVRRSAALTLESVDRIASMAGALLDAARLEAGEALKLRFERIDARDLLKSVGKSVKLAYGERVRLSWPDTPVEGTFASAGLVRVIENLIANAAKHGDPDAEITVTLERKPPYAVLRVHNWGKPIPPEAGERIFGEFVQTGEEAEPNGWGIGLAVVRAVAEASGGTVALESTAEAGTTFTVTFRDDGGVQHEHLTPDGPA